MTDTISFSAISPRLALPLLHAGQAQKEAFVNEAHARLDACIHCAIEDSGATPPAAPAEGTNWLVAAPASGDWAGHEGEIAAFQSGNWLFFKPFDGFRIFNRATGLFTHHDGAWQTAQAVPLPIGGAVADLQAREALANLVSALQTVGILPQA